MSTATEIVSTKQQDWVGYNPAAETYYGSDESKFVYEVVLKGTHHFGFYEKGSWWPFPIGPSLRRMESEILKSLNLPTGSQILDAGCGWAKMALYLASEGMRVTGVDIIDHHIIKAKENIAQSGLPTGQVTAHLQDFHDMNNIETESHDGLYTLQALGHALQPEKAVAEFYRVLRPGGRITVVEVESRRDADDTSTTDQLSRDLSMVSEYTALPINEIAHENYFAEKLAEAGFTDVQVQDWSENIKPIVRLIYLLVVVPFFFVRLLGLEKRFVNMVAGTSGYLGLHRRWRFVAVSATKPGGKIEGVKEK